MQRQLLHLRRHGGGKEQRLPLFFRRQQRHDAAHIVNKAHVQHAIGFVQHKNFQLIQLDEALTHQIIQPTGRGNENVHPAAQLLNLRILVDAAKNDGGAQRQIAPVLHKILLNLNCQFPRRGEDKRPNGVSLAARGAAVQPLEHRQRKRRRLAGSGLGTAQHIAPRQHQRNGLFLNGRGGLIPRRLHRAEQRRNQLEFVELHIFPNFK